MWDGLISRNFRPFKVRGAFWICSVVLIAIFFVPYIEGKSLVCLNGVFEMICIAIVFPVLVCIGASGKTTDKKSTSICRFLGDISYPLYTSICRFLGDISYPLYAVHYPVMYVFYSWLIENKFYTLEETWMVSAMVYFGSIALAYACLKLYDEPVRKWLGNKFVKSKPTV